MTGPKPTAVHPVKGFRHLCYISNTVKNPNIIIGDYTYYDDPDNSKDFEKNVLYHFPSLNDRLIIGKFCSIAQDVKFIMNGANHRMDCFSTYPFHVFGNGWESVTPSAEDLPLKGDIIIGNDVWLGYESIIMPGVNIGNGAIIGSRSVVSGNVEPYTVVAGNPARPIRKRFSDDVIDILQEIRWWDWPVELITENLELLTSNDVESLKRLSGKD